MTTVLYQNHGHKEVDKILNLENPSIHIEIDSRYEMRVSDPSLKQELIIDLIDIDSINILSSQA